jgi:Domain of unknown function (DUF6438)
MRPLTLVLGSAAAVLALVACPARTPRPAASIAADSIVLERGECFGSCPAYRLVVRGSGAVTFEGRGRALANVRDTGRVTPEQFSGLLDAFESGDFATFAARYVPGDSACGRVATDMPSATLTVGGAGGVRTVQHYHGCSDAPEALGRLEDRIDEVTNSARWTGRPPR